MKRVIRASQDNRRVFVLRYWAYDGKRELEFYSEEDLQAFVESHVFSEKSGKYLEAYEKRPIDIDPTVERWSELPMEDTQELRKNGYFDRARWDAAKEAELAWEEEQRRQGWRK